MRRAALAVLVTLLVVLAGCIGTGPTADDPATTTESTATGDGSGEDPATTGEQSGDDPDGSDGDLPPGVTRDGVTNLTALLAAHSQALQSQGFELRSVYSVEGSGATEGSDYRLDRRTRAEAGLDATRSDIVRTVDGERLQAEQWLNESLVLTRITDDGDVRYSGRKLPADEELGPMLVAEVADVYRLQSVLRAATLEVANVSRTDEGVRIHLESTAFGGGDGEEDRHDSAGRYVDGRVSLVVDEDGVIRSLAAAGTDSDGGTFAFEYRVERLGVESVERPAWLADAPPVVQPELDVEFENCTTPYLRLTHRGGDALPAGTTLALETGNGSYSATFDSAFDGGTRYVFLTPAGDLRISPDPPAADDRVSIGNEVSVTVVTDAGYRVLSAGMGFGCETAEAGESSGSGSSGGGSAGSRSADGEPSPSVPPVVGHGGR